MRWRAGMHTASRLMVPGALSKREGMSFSLAKPRRGVRAVCAAVPVWGHLVSSTVVEGRAREICTGFRGKTRRCRTRSLHSSERAACKLGVVSGVRAGAGSERTWGRTGAVPVAP